MKCLSEGYNSTSKGIYCFIHLSTIFQNGGENPLFKVTALKQLKLVWLLLVCQHGSNDHKLKCLPVTPRIRLHKAGMAWNTSFTTFPIASEGQDYKNVPLNSQHVMGMFPHIATKISIFFHFSAFHSSLNGARAFISTQLYGGHWHDQCSKTPCGHSGPACVCVCVCVCCRNLM